MSAEPLSRSLLETELGWSGEWRAPISVVSSTGSTNDDAKRAATEGAVDASVFVADRQDSGRGQRGRRWEAEPGSALLFSCLFRPNIPAASLPPLSLVVGLVVAQTVASWAGHRGVGGAAGVKWPNDVYVEGRKLAGVLVEAQITGQSVSSIVVGVGLNVLASAAPKDARVPAISLEEIGVSETREALLARLLWALRSAVVHYERDGLRWFLHQLRERDLAKGRAVTVDGVPARAAGIDDEGRLLVERDGIVSPVVSGDVVFALSG